MTTQSRDIKTQLAKLMATENLDVRFANVETASFDPENRVLTIPNYKDGLTREEYDLFIGHEVGHALYTPVVRPDEVDITRKGFGGFVNVVEDVRIEKAIQAKYPGLVRSFRAGYNDLISRGFFGDDIDYDDMNLGDKANMFFKAGFHHTGITFTDAEQKIVDDIESANTWDKVVKAAKDLYDFVGDQNDNDQPDDPNAGDEVSDEVGNVGSGESDSDGEAGDQTAADESADSSDSDDSNDSDDSDESGDEGDGLGNAPASSSDATETDDDGDDDSEGDNAESVNDDADISKSSSIGNQASEDSPTPEIKTQKAFDERSDSLKKNSSMEKEIVNGTIPDALDDSVIYWKDVYRDLKNRVGDNADALTAFTKKWKEFKAENKAIVSYLGKEFEMRKAADEHQRTLIAKTGQLDTRILHTYKFNEDLFKKAAVVMEGKNHGLVMVVDWSGSMGNCIVDTISQIQIMAMFCKQVNIPFDVYAFNGHFNGIAEEGCHGDDGYYGRNREGTDVKLPPSFTSDDGEIALEQKSDGPQGSFKLVNYLSSTMKNSQFETAMAYLTMVKDSMGAGSYSHRYDDNWVANPIASNAGWHRLGGTPLVQAIVATAKVVNEFRDKYHTQVVNTIFLTDGEGGYGQSVHGNVQGYGSDMVLHDRVTKRYYKQNRHAGYAVMFHNWLEWFYDRTGMKIINFYIYGSNKNELASAFRSFDIPSLHEDEYGLEAIINKDEQKTLAKEGFYYRDDIAGYRGVFFIRKKNLTVAENHMDTLDTDATVAKTRRAFIKNQRDKLSSRMFMDQVAKLIS